MSNYAAPIRDINFVLKHIVGMEALAALPGFEEATPELVEAIVDEAARLAAEVVAPTNQPADLQGARGLKIGASLSPMAWDRCIGN